MAKSVEVRVQIQQTDQTYLIGLGEGGARYETLKGQLVAQNNDSFNFNGRNPMIDDVVFVVRKIAPNQLHEQVGMFMNKQMVGDVLLEFSKDFFTDNSVEIGTRSYENDIHGTHETGWTDGETFTIKPGAPRKEMHCDGRLKILVSMYSYQPSDRYIVDLTIN
jgi:hypothetical protein